LEGEIWAQEWVEPADVSWRIAEERPPSMVSFLVDTSGARMNADALNDEDIGRYLWFRPEVVNDILSKRGARLEWHTKQTGSINLTHGYYTHFGINKIGLLNVYAYDVAKLPEWQRLLWQGHNVAPDGGVAAELLAAQMEAKPAGTYPPEKYLGPALRDLDILFSRRFSTNLFRNHAERDEILRNIHRFRALQLDGVFDLAKDITRLIIEDIDTKALHRIVAPKDEKRWSLKSLEYVIGELLSDSHTASEIMSPMHTIYAMRSVTSHLPSAQERAKALKSMGILANDSKVEQGRKILDITMYFLASIAKLLAEEAATATTRAPG
jgi:hypothetical protein